MYPTFVAKCAVQRRRFHDRRKPACAEEGANLPCGCSLTQHACVVS
jgi:hypothetical protein